MERTPHIAILSTPGMGHLIPIVALAKQLHHHHHFSVSIIIPTIGQPSKAILDVLQDLPQGINPIFPPPVTFDDLPEDNNGLEKLLISITRSLSPIRDALRLLAATTDFVALIVDILGTEAIDVAREFHVPSYLFFTSPAMALAIFLHVPKLDEVIQGEYRDLPGPLNIPGCIPVQASDLPETFNDRSSESYRLFLQYIKTYNKAEGIIVNSFTELEQGPIKALQGEELCDLPIYPVGPLVQSGANTESEKRHECLQWLDDQPRGSVLFVSFGSGGTLSTEQVNELAYGLETSGKKFLWVVRSPNDKIPHAAFFGSQSLNDPSSFLPEGFLERTKDQGLVVPSWAPQIEVLSHDSTGGFLTHCGWNSTLESMVHGVPLIAWPLYAEQKLNAAMLTEELDVALRPKVNQNGIIEQEEIAEIVRDLMEGEKGKPVRSRMKDLKDAAMKALGKGGSSMKSLSDLAIKWKNQTRID